MPEKESKLEIIQVDYLCDNCGEIMVMERGSFDDKIVESIFKLASTEMLYKCNTCGCRRVLKEKYPKIIHRKIEEGEE